MQKRQPKAAPTARSARFYSWEVREPCLELPFPAEEYESRMRNTRQAMQQRRLDALIVCGDGGHPGDLRWLANWSPGVGNAFLFVPAEGDPTLVLHDEVMGYDLCKTWVREIVPPTRGTESLLVVRNHLIDLLGEQAATGRLGVVGETGLPVVVYKGLLDAKPQLEIVDVPFFFAGLRAVKSPLELDKVREAVRQADAAMQSAVAMIREGVAEKEVVAEILRTIFLEGAEEPAFLPLVVAGPRAVWKHASPTARPIGEGEPVYIDLGATYDGYKSDLSRTVLLGEPNREQANALAFALEANAAVKEAARPGVPARRLAEVGDEIAIKFGLEGKAWGTGHGLGCKLREEPLLDRTNELVLQPGMVMAIEPMCVCEAGTFVVEDDILITEDGSEYLSHCPRKNWL